MVTQSDDDRLRTAEAVTFSDTLYSETSGAEGAMVLWTPRPKDAIWLPVSDHREIAQRAVQLSHTRDVYFGVGLRRPIAHPRFRRGTNDEIICLPALCADFDIAGLAHKAQNLPQDEEEVLALLKAIEMPPTIIVHTGHGLHAYWCLREPWMLRDSADRRLAADYSMQFQKGIRSAANRRGWTIDSTADLARVLRLPGTVNRKLDPMPVRILENDPSRRYERGDFDRVITRLLGTRRATIASNPPTIAKSAESSAARPEIGAIVDVCGWIRHCRDDAATLGEPEWYAMLSIVGCCANGESLAHDWSSPYTGYSPEETAHKLARAIRAAGPRTCRSIRDKFEGDSYCQNCRARNRVRTPLRAGAVLGTALNNDGVSQVVSRRDSRADQPNGSCAAPHSVLRGQCPAISGAGATWVDWRRGHGAISRPRSAGGYPCVARVVRSRDRRSAASAGMRSPRMVRADKRLYSRGCGVGRAEIGRSRLSGHAHPETRGISEECRSCRHPTD